MQVAISSAGFTYEIGVPTAALTTPSVSYLNDDITELVGTSTDTPAGIGTVAFAFSDNGGAANSWLTGWGGTFSGNAETYIATSAAGGYTIGTNYDTWRRSLAGLVSGGLVNGKLYKLRIRANDKAITPNVGGLNGAVRDYDLRYDTSKPTASIAEPVNGSYKKVNFTISGGSSDPDPGAPLQASGVSTISISIQLLGTGGSCYDPTTGFGSGCPHFFPAFGTVGAWSFTPSANPYTFGKSYSVLAQAADAAGKVQDTYGVGVSSVVFIYDDQRPSVSWTMPSTGRHKDLSSLAGGSSDGAPGVVKKVQWRVLQQTPSQFFAAPGNPFNFNIVPGGASEELVWTTATYAADWTNWQASSNVPWFSGRSYDVIARSLDDAGNYSVPYATHSVIFDDTPPETGVTAPANLSYVSSLPTISGTQEDKTSSGLSTGTITAVEVRIKRLSGAAACWDGAGWLGCPQTMTTEIGRAHV
jgi:hypothetical protein